MMTLFSRPVPEAIAGKVIAITGAARNIGRFTAEALVARGARVVIGDLNEEATKQTAAEINAQFGSQGGHVGGGEVIGVRLDVTDPLSLRLFADAAEHHFGPIDIYINNAGIMWPGRLEDEPDHVTQGQIAVNLLGVIRGVKLMVPRMKARGQGHIVTVASLAALLTPAGEATYAATKHGVLGYLKTARMELRSSPVKLSVILPAVVNTVLAHGTSPGAVRLLEAHEIAAAIVGVIERPRFETVVPGWLVGVYNASRILPEGWRLHYLGLILPDQLKELEKNKKG